MPPGPDGDDEELVEIDVEIEGPPPLPRQAQSDARPDASAPDLLIDAAGAEDTAPNRDAGGVEGPPPPDLLEITDAVELQPPLVEASEDDPAAALTIFAAEAAAAEGGRRGALLLEVARLREGAAGAEGEDRTSAALEAAG